MADILPFKAIIPQKDKAGLIASKSVDFYSQEEILQILQTNKLSFLNIILPGYGTKEQIGTPGSVERLKKIKEQFSSFLKNGVLQQLHVPVYFIYRQSTSNFSYTGIIACASVNDYKTGVIKIHEHTLTDREKKLKDYLTICDFNAEPVLFSYPDSNTIESLIRSETIKPPEIAFTTDNDIKHELWITPSDLTHKLHKEFEKIPAIYIADGHHRSASSALFGEVKKQENKNHTGKEAYNFYLGAFFPESQLRIVEFNRIVKDLNGLTPSEFLVNIQTYFSVIKQSAELIKPTELHEIVLYIDKKWYLLKPRPVLINKQNPVESLDVHILSEYILSPILGIKDLKTDKRISFVPGIKDYSVVIDYINAGKAQAAFFLYPIHMGQIKNVADSQLVMPPKSTWVEPKMLSGLTIYSLEGNI